MVDEGVDDVELFVDGEKIGLNEFVVKILSDARLDTRDNFGYKLVWSAADWTGEIFLSFHLFLYFLG